MRSADDLPGTLPTVPGILRLVNRLEQAWQDVPADLPPPELNAYLPAPADPLRPAAVRELVRLDLEMRWRRGLPALLESYLLQFPELGGPATVSAELIYHEYRVRRQYGDRPSVTIYRQRFPAQYRQLLALAQGKPNAAPAAGKASAQANPPTPSASGDAGAPPKGETSARSSGTVPPTPASGKKSGDILLPPLNEATGEADPGYVPMVGGYRLLKRLGAGALGEVWKAEAPGGVEVAVKRLSRTLEADAAKYELQSLEHVKKLHHHYLAQIHAYWVHKNRLFVVMDLADGSLLDRVDFYHNQGLPGIPHDELLRYMREVAEALDFLHAENVHHRDIKPANILLLGDHVKVADFGLARPLQGDQSLVQGTFCGTPGFMAPEVWENLFSTQSDQWSLAVTYLELRLNRPFFKGRNLPSLMTEIRKGDYDLSPLEKSEQRVLCRALHHHPRERYPNCAAFAADLDAVFRPAPPPPPPPRRWLQTAAASLVCLVAGILLASLFARIYRPVPPAPDVQIVEADRPPEVRIIEADQPELLVHTGRGAALTLTLERKHFEGPIELVADDRPRGVDVKATTGPGANALTISAHAAKEAAPGMHPIRLHSTEGTPRVEMILSLTVLYLPEKFQVMDATMEKDIFGVSYYKRIRRSLSDTEAVEFVLVPREKTREQLQSGEPKETFYICRHKITRGQFRLFAADPKNKTDERWRKHAQDNDRMPIRDVTVSDAHKFALWLGGAKLPSPEQWDKATGCYHSSRGHDPYWEGPFKGRWTDQPKPRVAVPNLRMPVAVKDDQDRDDVSVYGCQGMAGTGKEWTRKTIGELDQRVILRGWPFQGRPATFEELRKIRNDLAEGHEETSPDLGFRVVLEPNG